MSNAIRYRTGPRMYRNYAVDTDGDISLGDLVFFDTSDSTVKPAASFPWTTSLAVTQSNFAKVFVGVAAQQAVDGDPSTIDVDVSPDAVYEFNIVSATVENGDVFGPSKASGNALLSQSLTVSSSGSEAMAIARAIERHASATTKCRVTFASAYSTSSANAAAQLGS